MTDKEKIAQLEAEMVEIKQFLNKLMSQETLPFAVESAISTRLGGFRTTTSAKGVTSENQAVAEAGSATYSVMKPPDGFREMLIEGGSTIYIPYFT